MNKSIQKPTFLEKKTGLTPIQEQAAMLLASGKTISEVSGQLNINRGTLYLWFEKLTFQCFYNTIMKEIQNNIRDGIFSLYSEALQAIRQNLSSPNESIRMKAATYIIDKIQSSDVGETSPENIIRKQCTSNEIENPWPTYFDEKKFEDKMKENGLI